MIELGL